MAKDNNTFNLRRHLKLLIFNVVIFLLNLNQTQMWAIRQLLSLKIEEEVDLF